MSEQLQQYIQRYVPITAEEYQRFRAFLKERRFAKKDFLLREGEVCRHYYFLEAGLLRSYYLDENGHEKITQFGIENWWMTDLESFTTQRPSKIYMQALEPTRALSIDYADLESAFRTVPKMERFFRKLTERMYIALHNKHEYYLQQDGHTKYFGFLQQIPNFVQRVPQYMLASYLEITPEHLSYLRKKAAEKS